MKDFLHSKTARFILWGLGGLVVLLIVFGAGMMVGYRSGLFASRFGANYYHNFLGVGMGPGPMIQPYGATGVVISVGSSTLATKDPNGDEESIVVDSGTVIREMNATIPLGDVQDGSHVAVIGDPNGMGQIHARFIRIFGASSSMPAAPDSQ